MMQFHKLFENVDFIPFGRFPPFGGNGEGVFRFCDDDDGFDALVDETIAIHRPNWFVVSVKLSLHEWINDVSRQRRSCLLLSDPMAPR